MKRMWLVGLNTFRESIRKKTLYIILIFALIVIGASKLFSFLTAEEELKMIKDVSFSAIEFFGALIAIFGALYAVSAEIERRTIYTLLTKPIRRSDFVIGKFFGVSMIIFVNFVLAAAFFIGLLIFKKSPPDIQVFKTLLLIFFELILIGSITLALSTFTSDAFNIICSFFLYIVGHLTSYGKELIERMENIVMKGLTDMLYTLVPNYENFNIRDKIVVGLDVSWSYVGWTVLYGILYMCIALYIALYFFEKREV
ncbi:MAG: ABC transporter permease [Candidatus Omnitrophica bacterium]|nr:ABC transporter permease [Candidatus Omnitrophota bacterium]MCM8817156.1 ABC transporter permease [Candidatus Omnitrophota bacterium]